MRTCDALYMQSFQGFFPSKMHAIQSARHIIAHLFSWRGLDKLHYPVSIADIPEIEKKLELNINVFSFYDDVGRARHAMYLSKTNFEHTLDLLYWNCHYAQITNFSTFMSEITMHKTKKYFCKRCLGHFYSESDLATHKTNCTATEGHKQVLELPTKTFFSNSRTFDMFNTFHL